MNKSERIKMMVDEGVRTFDEIIEITNSAPSYVKAQFTKLGLDWATYEPEGNAPVEEVVEEVEELSEEQEEILEEIDSIEDPDLARLVYEGLELLEVANKNYIAGRLKQTTDLFRKVAKETLDNRDFALKKQVQLNCQVSRMYPRPAPVNHYKEIYHLHIKIRELFNYYYKNCHGK